MQTQASSFSRERLFARHLATAVIGPTLRRLGLGGSVPTALLLGIAAQESGGFAALYQVGGGPARGLWQIEPATHDDVWANFLPFNHTLQQIAAFEAAPGRSRVDQLADNLSYGCAIARLILYRAPEAMPATPDPALLGGYWKRHFNTALGAGTVDEFIQHFNDYVGDFSQGDFSDV